MGAPCAKIVPRPAQRAVLRYDFDYGPYVRGAAFPRAAARGKSWPPEAATPYSGGASIFRSPFWQNGNQSHESPYNWV